MAFVTIKDFSISYGDDGLMKAWAEPYDKNMVKFIIDGDFETTIAICVVVDKQEDADYEMIYHDAYGRECGYCYRAIATRTINFECEEGIEDCQTIMMPAIQSVPQRLTLPTHQQSNVGFVSFLYEGLQPPTPAKFHDWVR